MKKFQKILYILLIISIIYLITYNAYAASGAGDIWQTAKNFLDGGSSTTFLDSVKTGDIKSAFMQLADFLWGIGLMVILVTTIVLGIRYMTVGPNEKSRIKQATTPYIIGVVIIFGAVTIWRLIINIIEGSLGIGG